MNQREMLKKLKKLKVEEPDLLIKAGLISWRKKVGPWTLPQKIKAQRLIDKYSDDVSVQD